MGAHVPIEILSLVQEIYRKHQPDDRKGNQMSEQTTVEAGARFKFLTGHEIDVHELWHGQWLYQVWPPGVETQGPFDRLSRMKAEDFEREVAARGGKRVR